MAQDDEPELSPAPPAPTGRATASKPAIAFAVSLALATLVTYAGVLENDFTSFDDPQYIVDNAQVKGGLRIEGLVWAFTHAHSDNWHPLTWLSHMADVEWFGLDPRGHHAVSVLLHAANGALLFALLLRTTRQPIAGAIVALLFALHPLRVESVAWAAERKDVLSGFFFLLTLNAYASWNARRTTGRYLAVLGLFALGLLAKPMLVTLPFLLLLWDRWPLERFRDGWPPRRLWVEKAPLFALAVASSCATVWAQSIGGTMKSLEFISLSDRLLNAASSIWIYLSQLLWPVDLAFFYPHPALVEGGGSLRFELLGIAGGVGIVLVTIGVLRRLADSPWLAVGWGFWLIALAPVIGIVQVGIQAHADRYTYLPGIGLLVAAVYGVTHLVASHREDVQAFPPRGRMLWLSLGSVLVALVLASLTARQVTIWRSSERLYQHALEVTHDNYIAAFNLGALAGRAGDDRRAMAFYRQALAMRPDYAAAHSNLGVTLDRLGDVDRAAEHYREALRLDPRLAQAALNLGTLHLGRGEVERAREFYRRAVEARLDLALPRETLGELEAKLGHVAAAIAQFEAAVEIAPGAATARTRLADAYAGVGREREAADQYRAALARDPAQLAAMNALARLLATARDPAVRAPLRALDWAKRASAGAGGRNPTFLMTLALAHAAAGEAVEASRQRDRSLGFAKPEEREALRALFERYVSEAETRAPERDASS